MGKDVSVSPFKMFFRKISGKDLTGNSGGGNKKLLQTTHSSVPTRNNTLNDFTGDQSDYFGNDSDYDFYGASQKFDDLPRIVDDATLFNSRLNLSYELPSTGRINRFNAQNKG